MECAPQGLRVPGKVKKALVPTHPRGPPVLLVSALLVSLMLREWTEGGDLPSSTPCAACLGKPGTPRPKTAVGLKETWRRIQLQGTWGEPRMPCGAAALSGRQAGGWSGGESSMGLSAASLTPPAAASLSLRCPGCDNTRRCCTLGPHGLPWLGSPCVQRMEQLLRGS